MPGRDPSNLPMTVTADSGAVIIDGPDISLTLTPEAAAESSERLFQCSALAAGQRRLGQVEPSEEKGQ